MCKYCSKPCNNENILDTCSADGYSFQKIYIARVTVPSHESFIPKEKFCLVVRHAFMGNSCETVTPIDYCIKCGRNLEDTTMSNLNHDENFQLEEGAPKMSKLTPIDLECNMGKDINGVEHREPWKAYDIDEVDALLAEKDKQIRRLKRVLYKACSNWGLSTLAWLDCIDQGNPAKWSKMIQRCLKKARANKSCCMAVSTDSQRAGYTRTCVR